MLCLDIDLLFQEFIHVKLDGLSIAALKYIMALGEMEVPEFKPHDPVRKHFLPLRKPVFQYRSSHVLQNSQVERASFWEPHKHGPNSTPIIYSFCEHRRGLEVTVGSLAESKSLSAHYWAMQNKGLPSDILPPIS